MLFLPLGKPPELIQAGYSPTGFKPIEATPALPFWQLHLYLYDGQLFDNDEWKTFGPGWISLTPPKLKHQVKRPKQSPHYYLHFNASGSPEVSLERLWKLNGEMDWLNEEITQLIKENHKSAVRSKARLWETLWQLADMRSKEPESKLHRGLEAALHYLDKNLETPKPLAFLAERLGLSPSHVSRLFKQQIGETPIAWQRRRKAERARLMLRESHLSPAQIAESLGIRDLQRFNKLMRKEFGLSPRALRK
jgi:AraC-like DNA-binding protein